MKKFSPLEFGGATHKGRRKTKRPFIAKQPLHVVMRSSRARGVWNFHHSRHKGLIHALVIDTAAQYGVRIHAWENVFNHLHLVIQARRRADLVAFLRVLLQRIMFAVTGAGRPKGRFFDNIVWSRVVEWGKEYKRLLDYVWKNTLEALGFSRDVIRIMRHNSRRVPLMSG